MLLNHLLFWMMITEGVICLLISLPFGQRASQAVIQFLAARIGGKDSKAAFVGSIMLALVSILFLSDVSTCYKHHSSGTILSDGMRIRLLVAQRDMYITGFVLFLFLLLRLVYMSTEKNIRLEKSLGALKKQAEGASSGFKQQLEENEAMKKQITKMHALVGGDDASKKGDVLAQLVEENAALTTQLEAAKKELTLAESKVANVQKQAEGQSSAFMKLLDEKNAADKLQSLVDTQQATLAQQAQELKALTTERDSLRSQIQDYDFMFAEAKKKAE